MVKNGKSLIKYQDHVAAMKYPADLIIMTNDGTFGDKVLERFDQPASKVRFWLNGVSLDIYKPGLKDWLRTKYKIEQNTKILLTVSR